MEVLLPIALLATAVLLRIYFKGRTGRALRSGAAQGDDERCWICGKSDVREVEADVFRCPACGTFQGVNADDYLARQRRAALFALPADERRERARTLLDETKLALSAASGELEHVLSLSRTDRWHDGDENAMAQEKHARFGAVLAQVRGVQRQLGDVVALLGSYARVPAFDVELDAPRYALDAMDLADARIHRDLERCGEHLENLGHLRGQLAAELASKAQA